MPLRESPFGSQPDEETATSAAQRAGGGRSERDFGAGSAPLHATRHSASAFDVRARHWAQQVESARKCMEQERGVRNERGSVGRAGERQQAAPVFGRMSQMLLDDLSAHGALLLSAVTAAKNRAVLLSAVTAAEQRAALARAALHSSGSVHCVFLVLALA